AACEGARVFCMRTVASVNERAHLAAQGPDANLPVWAKLDAELQQQGIESRPVAVLDDAGAVLPQRRAVLSLVAAHGMVLATGHLGRDEVFAVVEAAREEGVC